VIHVQEPDGECLMWFQLPDEKSVPKASVLGLCCVTLGVQSSDLCAAVVAVGVVACATNSSFLSFVFCTTAKCCKTHCFNVHHRSWRHADRSVLLFLLLYATNGTPYDYEGRMLLCELLVLQHHDFYYCNYYYY
jgi:hypothetical protein